MECSLLKEKPPSEIEISFERKHRRRVYMYLCNTALLSSTSTRITRNIEQENRDARRLLVVLYDTISLLIWHGTYLKDGDKAKGSCGIDTRVMV